MKYWLIFFIHISPHFYVAAVFLTCLHSNIQRNPLLYFLILLSSSFLSACSVYVNGKNCTITQTIYKVLYKNYINYSQLYN